MITLYDACLKCNICDMHCPVLKVDPRFPGPKNGGPGLERLRAAGKTVDEAGLDLCLGCRTCETVCPSGISPAALIAKPKIEKVRRKGLTFRDWLLTHSELLGAVARPVAGLANGALKVGALRTVMEKVVRVDRRKPFPAFSGTTFRGWFARRPNPWRNQAAPNGQVVYFHGCSTNTMLPEIGMQTVAILEHNGFEVILPEQKCCGLPLIANGKVDEAAGWARFNVEHLRPYAETGIPIVFTSTSCSLTVKSEYSHLLGVPGAEAVGAQSYDFFEFLLLLHEQGKLRTDFQAMQEELPYHQPCHQRVQGIGLPVIRLLRLIPGVKAWNVDAGCCGASGTHGFKHEKYDLAMAVGHNLGDALREADGHRTISDCEACRWQMEHLSGKPAVHPLSVLFEAYGLGA